MIDIYCPWASWTLLWESSIIAKGKSWAKNTVQEPLSPIKWQYLIIWLSGSTDRYFKATRINDREQPENDFFFFFSKEGKERKKDLRKFSCCCQKVSHLFGLMQDLSAPGSLQHHPVALLKQRSCLPFHYKSLRPPPFSLSYPLFLHRVL